MLFIEFMKSGEGAISSDGNECFDTKFPQAFACRPAAVFRPELLATRRLQDRAAPLYDVAYRAGTEAHNIALDHAFIAAHDTVYFLLVKNSRSNHCTDRRVHSRRITAGCEDTDLAYLLFHLDV